MDNSKNNSKFVTILDCCYAGKAIEGTKGISDGAITLGDSFEKIGDSTSNTYKNKSIRVSKIILASSQADQSAREEYCKHDDDQQHFHGIFSYHLIEGLRGKANPIGGDITPDNIYKYIKEQMKNYSSQIIRYGAQIQQDKSSIILASYGEKDKEIKDILEHANIFSISVTDIDLGLLIFASKELWRLEDPKLCPHLNDSQKHEYNTIKMGLNKGLTQNGTDLCNWFDKNAYQRPRYIFAKVFSESRKNIYSELRNLSEGLSYEVVAKMTDLEKRCLMAVFRFMKSPKDEDDKLEELEKELKRQV
jgi:hypothetical protein